MNNAAALYCARMRPRSSALEGCVVVTLVTTTTTGRQLAGSVQEVRCSEYIL